MSLEEQDQEMKDAPVLEEPEEPKEHDLDSEFSIRVVSLQFLANAQHRTKKLES